MFWVEVLNQSVVWEESEFRLDSRSEVLAPALRQALRRDLTTLRAAYAAPALGRGFHPPESSALNQWLAEVTLAPHPGAPDVFSWPALVARRRTSELPRDVEALLSTACLQLLSLGGVTAVHRCHGLVRAAQAPAVFAAEDEALFARRAGLGNIPGEWRQCPHLVAAPRAAHFCSKTCSNAAFAARKAARDPRYFAEKQRLYRARQRASTTPAPRPFMFVD